MNYLHIEMTRSIHLSNVQAVIQDKRRTLLQMIWMRGNSARTRTHIFLYTRSQLHQQIHHLQREGNHRLFPYILSQKHLVGQSKHINRTRQFGKTLNCGMNICSDIHILRLDRNTLHRLDMKTHQLLKTGITLASKAKQ